MYQNTVALIRAFKQLTKSGKAGGGVGKEKSYFVLGTYFFFILWLQTSVAASGTVECPEFTTVGLEGNHDSLEQSNKNM